MTSAVMATDTPRTRSERNADNVARRMDEAREQRDANATRVAAMTYTELITDRSEEWDYTRIAVELDVAYQTVTVWGLHSRRQGGAGPVALPHPDAGDRSWYPGTIREWAMQVGLMSPTGEPQDRKQPGKGAG